MSPAEREARATETALAEEFRTAIDDARERIAAVLGPACPTPAFLDALRDEVRRALDDPSTVPFPELADPEAYWDATVKPQSRALRDDVAAIVEWLEQRIITTMEVAEADLKAVVDRAVADPGTNPEATRTELAADLEDRCLALHHQMAEVLSVLPASTAVGEARLAAEDAIRAAASSDVEGLRAAYLRDAGGDEDHQRFAAQQWSETFAERVAHRVSMLAAEPPWRHQEFALVGYERARVEIDRLVEETTARLQAPLRGLADLLVERFDASVDGRPVGVDV